MESSSSAPTHMASSTEQLQLIHDDSKLPCSSSQLENVSQQFLASQLECSAMVNSSKEDQRASDDNSIIYKLKCVKYTSEELAAEESQLCFESGGQYEQEEGIEQSSIDNDKVVEMDGANRPDSMTREEMIKLSGDDAHIEHYTQQTPMSVSDYPTNDGDLVSSSVGLSAVLPTTASMENSELDREFLQGIANSHRFTLSLQEADTIHQDNRSRVASLYQMSADMINGDLASTREGEVGDVSANRFTVPELLDPALLRLIDHRLSTMIGSSLSSLPPDQKEMLLESVVRNMIGIVGNRLYTSDGVLLETKLESSNINKDVSSTGYTGGELHMAPMYAEASGLIDTLANDTANRVESPMPQCASSNLLSMEDVSLQVISSAAGARPAILHQSAADAATKMVEIIDHQRANELQVNSSTASSTEQLIQVPVSEVSGTSGLLNFVSSSTGLEREVVCLDGQNVVLDTSVDAVVVSSEGQTGQEKTLHLVDSAGQPFAIELENQDGSTLRFSEIDSDRYSTEVHIHELDTEQNVTSTVDISSDAALMAVSKSGETIATTSIDIPLTLVHHHIDAACSSMATDSIMAIPDNKQLTGHSRPRRNVAKHRLMRNSSDSSADLGKWCEECNASYVSGCTKHRVQLISDKPVLTRARASLPATYLSISKVSTTSTGENVYGVVAKKAIMKRTQFGPLEGAQSKKPEDVSGSSSFVLQVETEDNELVSIDTSDESQSNWMGFVRAAENYKEQNLVVMQQGQCLYYTTTRTIVPKTELKVGYSLQYATRRGLTVLEADKQVKDEEDNSWPCFECNKSFSTSEELQHHLNEHDGNDVVSETIPFDEDKAKATAAARKYSKSKSKTSKKSKTNSGLKKSKKSVGGNEEYRCDLCMKTFPRQYSLQRHQAMHSGEKKYKCSVCDMRFTHVYNRNRHMRRHRTQSIPVESSSMKKPIKTLFKKRQVGGCEWECTHCNLTFDNPSLLNLHTLTHAAEDVGLDEFNIDSVINNKDNDFHENGYELEDVISSEVLQCPQCTQNFPTKKELIEHASTHGKILQRKSFRGIVNPAKPYKCDLCYKAFAAEDRLQRHMMVHGSEEEKPLQCCFCEKRFLNNSALACHVKVHSDEKKIYECPICKEEFDQVVLLKEHIRIHSISGYFTCPSCQKSFDEYNQIRKHIRIFHSDKKFPCDHCDKVFPRPDKLKLHMLRHSTHREFLCASCGKQFKRKDKLKEHMKRMHSMEREARLAMKPQKVPSLKKFIPKVLPTDYHRFIYKCHACLLGFKRRGMLVNHLAKRHPDIRPESVPELNLPILKTTRDYYCQYCEKIYKSSSKRKAHIMKQHPGAELPMSNRRKGGIPEIPGMPNPTYSQTVGSVTTLPHNCEWCHKQYASKAKLLQHQRKKHISLLPEAQQVPRSHHRDSVKPNSQQLYVHEQITVTTQTSDVEFSDSVTDEMKSKNEVTEIYVDQDEVHTTVVVASEEKTNQASSAEQMPPADLLTQAMSELTQSLTEYVSHDFNLTRTQQQQQPCSSAFVASPSSSQSSLQPVVVSRSTEVAIDQSQLGQLLGHHYQGKIEPTTHQEGGVSISSSFIQQSWTRTNFTEYSDH